MPEVEKKAKKSWYVEEWSIEANNNTFSSLVDNNAAAAQVAKTSSYISFYPDKDFRDLEVKGKSKKQRLLNENFPFFQKVSGDGLCGFHAATVGTLAKCAENPKALKEFRKKLEQYPSEIFGKKESLEAKKVITAILRKLPKDNLTFDRFYELASEEGKENISKKLANILFKNADFSTPKNGENPAQKEARESDLEAQEKFLKNPKKAQILVSDFAIIDIMQSISPFKIETVTSENLEGFFGKTQKDTIYLVNGDGKHFDLLYSKSDENMVKAAKEVSAENVAAKKDSETVRISPKEERDRHRKGVVDKFNDFHSNHSKPESAVVRDKVKSKVSFDEKEHVVEFDFRDPPKEIAQAAQKIQIKKPAQEKVKPEVDKGRIAVLKNKFQKFQGHQAKQEAIEKLIKPTEEQKDGYKIFDNKFIRALKKVNELAKEFGKNKEQEVWKSLTTLDKRVLVESYNQSHQAAEIDFNSLFRFAKLGEKAELTVKSQNYVFDESKMSDLKKILYYSYSLKSPSASMKKTAVSSFKGQSLGSSALTQ